MTYKELLFQAYLTIDGLVECINTAISSKDWKVDGACDPDLAIHRLREALAEQAEQEPVAWMVYTADGQSVYVTDNPTDIKDGQRALPLYTSPVEPVKHEPIIDLSKLLHEDKCCYWDDERFCNCGADSYELLKWYRKNAAPFAQQVTPVIQAVRTKDPCHPWQDLTDNEIEIIWEHSASTAVDFARAVIAADREKNK